MLAFRTTDVKFEMNVTYVNYVSLVGAFLGAFPFVTKFVRAKRFIWRFSIPFV